MATVNLMRNYCIPMHLDTKAKQLRKSLLALTNVFSPTDHSWWWLQTFSSCIYKTFYNECKTRSINGQLQPLWNLISFRLFYLVANWISHYIKEEEEEEEEIISKNQRYWNCRQISFLQQTLQELRMLSSVTLNCQATKIVVNSGSQLSELELVSQMSQVSGIVYVFVFVIAFVFVLKVTSL